MNEGRFQSTQETRLPFLSSVLLIVSDNHPLGNRSVELSSDTGLSLLIVQGAYVPHPNIPESLASPT